MLLARQIESFLRTGEGDFENLALELFAYQFERNDPYRAYCQAQEATPQTVRHWVEIPAVPVRAFKAAQLTTFPPAQAAAIFHSSSTTSDHPSRHFLKTMSYYETALKYSFQRHILRENETLPFLILAPAPNEAPHSSLTWMFEVARRKWGAPGSDYFIQRGRLDSPRLTRLLKKYETSGQPVCLLGTTLAFLAFFDECPSEPFRLHTGSRLLDTGGMKTAKREVTRPDFVRHVGERLSIPEDQCVSEYGMCEMSSQLYGRGSDPRLSGPPWMRTLAIDPATGAMIPSGETGILRHLDLANVDSVAMIQTDDLGQIFPEGVRFMGRQAGADLKGCSRAAEVLLG